MQVEENLRKVLGEKAFKALRWHISRRIGIDMVEAFEKNLEEVTKALEEFFKSKYAAKLILEAAMEDQAKRA